MQRGIFLVLLTALLWGLNQNAMAQAPSPGFNPVLPPGQTPLPLAPKMNNLGPKPLTKLPNKLAVTPIEKKPGAIIIPRENCGDYHTGWVDVPNADVNPCPKSCQRGEQLSVKQHPGNTSLYDAWMPVSLSSTTAKYPETLPSFSVAAALSKRKSSTRRMRAPKLSSSSALPVILLS